MQEGSDPTRGMIAWPALAATEVMSSLNKQAVAAILDFNGTLCSRMAAINVEWAAFVGKRLTEDFKLSQQVAACRSPDQLLEAYSSFLQKAFEQYQSEFAHMLKFGQALASQNAGLLKASVETALREEAPHEPAAQRRKMDGGNRRQLDSAA